jgi:glycine cleavage system H lipoate-binding protein
MVALAIVGIILLALTLDFLVERWPARGPASSVSRLPAWLARPIPVGVLVDSAHVWLHREKGRLVRLGGDGFAAALLGNPDAVTVVARPDMLSRGEPLAVLSRQGKSITLRSPVSGELVEYNAELDAKDVSSDPFGRGWFAMVRPERATPDDGLLKTDRARAWLAAEWERLRAFVLERTSATTSLGATMADGGPLQPGVLLQLAEPDERALEAAFFSVAPMEDKPAAPARQEGRK